VSFRLQKPLLALSALAAPAAVLVLASGAPAASSLCATNADRVGPRDPISACSLGDGQTRLGARAVAIARHTLGVRYRSGGSSPSTGFDCSGLVAYVFAQLGVHLPHNAAAQYGRGRPVAREELEPGDLVFFASLSHVGIYIGSGQFVHAPHSGTVVKISSLTDSWYRTTFAGSRRLSHRN
jgi:hypothetical protein